MTEPNSDSGTVSGTDEPRRITRDELRTLFLFESLTDEQLD